MSNTDRANGHKQCFHPSLQLRLHTDRLLACAPFLQVQKVYLLVRGKRNLSANERVQKLLCGPLFHKLHAEAAAGGRNPFSKVHGVEGDMEMLGLGLSAADKQLLLSEVDIVVHSAASLTLDAHIQDALRCADSLVLWPPWG